MEAMKVMNEIKSQISGTVLSIDVKDGDTVEFDQVLIMVG
ncbi:MAG: biotin/lipoyl-containing protein [Coprobacillus sp.]